MSSSDILEQDRVKNNSQNSFQLLELFQSDTPQKSQFQSQYRQILFIPEKYQDNKFEQIIKNQKGEFIIFNQQQFEEQLTISFIKRLSNLQAVRCLAKLGNFKLEISILNIKGVSCTHHLKHLQSTFAHIYFSQSIQGNFVVKCFSFKPEQYIKQVICALKEYFIYKVASLLKVGPSFIKPFGFDLIIYENCIQFAIEECLPINKLNKFDQQTLKKKLQMLHSYHIVHLDIKPQNIGFCPSLGCVVFIDFGISKCVKQKIGEKTFTKFAGSPIYCSPQMLKIVSSYMVNFIDLYHNDACCLKQTIQQLIKIPEIQNLVETNKTIPLKNKQINQIYYLACLKMEIKYKLFIFSSFEQIQSNIHLFQSNKIQMLQFVRQLPYSLNISHLQQLILKSNPQKKRQTKNQVIQLQYKQNNLFSLPADPQHDTQNQTFKMRMNCLLNLHKRQLYQKLGIEDIKINISQILLNQKRVIQIDKQLYYRQFITFVDFTSNTSTIEQKIKAAKLMITTLGLDINLIRGKYNKIESNGIKQFDELCICLVYLKDQYLSKQYKKVEQIITILFVNIIILQILHQQQIKLFVHQIASINLDPIKKSVLLFRCYTICDWINQRSSSRYKYMKMTKILTSILQDKIIQIYHSLKPPNQLVTQLVKLMNITSQTITRILSNKFTISSSALYVQNLTGQIQSYLIILKTRQYNKYGKSEEIIKLLPKFNEIQTKSQASTRIRLNYINFAILTNLISVAFLNYHYSIYHRFLVCLQHPKLIKKYCIYYYTLNKLFIHRKKSFQFYCQDILTYEQQELYLCEDMIGLLLQVKKSREFKQSAYSSFTEPVQNYCRQIFRVQKLKEIKFPQNNESSVLAKFYRNWYYIFEMTYNTYKVQQNVLESISAILGKLELFWQKIVCNSCKKQSFILLIRSKTMYFKYSNKLDECALLYLKTLAYFKTELKQYFFQTFLEQQLLFFVKNPQISKRYNALSQTYNFFQNRTDICSYFFSFGQKWTFFSDLFYFIFITNKNMSEYLQCQLKIAQLLQNFSSRQYISCYANQIASFVCQNTHTSFFTFLQKQMQTFPHLFAEKRYIIIFYCCLLNSTVVNDFTMKLIKIICNNLLYLCNFGKKYVIMKLCVFCINFKLIQSPKISMRETEKLKKKYVFGQIYFLSNDSRIKKRQNRLYFHKMKELIRLSYQFLVTKEPSVKLMRQKNKNKNSNNKFQKLLLLKLSKLDSLDKPHSRLQFDQSKHSQNVCKHK